MHFRPRLCCGDCLRVSFGWMISFGRITRKRLISFVWDCAQMVILFVWITWKNMVEMGRGGACVPARVALQGRIRHSSPAHNACIFGMETPLRGRSGGHTGAAPTVSFGWITRKRLVSFGDCA